MTIREATVFDFPAIDQMRRSWFDVARVPYYEREGTVWLVAEGEGHIYACLGYQFSAQYNQYHCTDIYRVHGMKGTRGVSLLSQALEAIADEGDAAVVLHIHPKNESLQVAAYNRGYDPIELNMCRPSRSIVCHQQ